MVSAYFCGFQLQFADSAYNLGILRCAICVKNSATFTDTVNTPVLRAILNNVVLKLFVRGS